MGLFKREFYPFSVVFTKEVPVRTVSGVYGFLKIICIVNKIMVGWGRGGGGLEMVASQQGGAATRIAPLLPGLTSQGGRQRGKADGSTLSDWEAY